MDATAAGSQRDGDAAGWERDRDAAGSQRDGDAAGWERDRDAAGWERDRDAAGRPRNARPRDSLGRPLARDAVGQPVLPDGLDVTPDWALATAQQLLDDGRPFHAHEVLEAAWKSAPPAERNLWQGLAQLAVGLTHALRGNDHGSAALLRRGAGRLRGYAGSRPHGIAVDSVIEAANGLAGQIESGGLTGLGPADLTLRLTADPSPPPEG